MTKNKIEQLEGLVDDTIMPALSEDLGINESSKKKYNEAIDILIVLINAKRVV